MSEVRMRLPRTPDEPMAFTRDELLCGGWTTWLVFMALLLGGGTLAFVVFAAPMSGSSFPEALLGVLMIMLAVAVVGGGVSLFLVPFLLLIAWPIGHGLRRTRSRSVHLVVYAALGLALGIVYLALMRGGRLFDALTAWDALAVAPAAAVTIAVPLGWWLTVRRVLRMDAGLTTGGRKPLDRDAAVEDAALDA